MYHALFAISLFASSVHGEGVVVSMTFSQGKLMGVAADADHHRALADRMKLPLVHVSDNADPATLMAEIQRATRGRDPVVLLYAGHGLALKPPLTDEDVRKAAAPLKLPMYSSHDDDDEDGVSPARDPRCKDSRATDFLFASEATMECMKDCRKPCVDDCEKPYHAQTKVYAPTDLECRGKCPRGPARRACSGACDDVRDGAQKDVRERLRQCRYRCEKDVTASGCGRACAKRHALSANALAGVLKGKHVVGVVDACESGALKNTELRGQFLAAVESDSLAIGKTTGGETTQSVIKQLGDAACDANTTRDGQLTLPQMLTNVAKTGYGCEALSPAAPNSPPLPVRDFDYKKTCAGAGATESGREGTAK